MTTEQLFPSTEYCCGCSACKSSCPAAAIEMKADGCGFIYPQIDEALCIDCGRCKKACRFQAENHGQTPSEAYAGITDATNITKSASGGAFACLAKSVLDKGGIVYGAAMQNGKDGLRTVHQRVDSNSALTALLGSKYVQSDIGNAYQLAEADLKNGKCVLFSGTPCQIAGLYGFLGKNYDRLLTADVICHGVPSAALFSDYLKTLEHKQKISEFLFRSKDFSGEMTARLTYENGKQAYLPCNASSYFYLFLHGHIYRDACYRCPYAAMERISDITLGDFWGIEKHHPDFPAEKGVSCILINTQKGKNAFDAPEGKMLTFPTTPQKIAEGNAQLRHPSRMTAQRKTIINAYQSGGYAAVEKQYRRLAGSAKYISKAKLFAKKVLK